MGGAAGNIKITEAKMDLPMDEQMGLGAARGGGRQPTVRSLRGMRAGAGQAAGSLSKGVLGSSSSPKGLRRERTHLFHCVHLALGLCELLYVARL